MGEIKENSTVLVVFELVDIDGEAIDDEDVEEVTVTVTGPGEFVTVELVKSDGQVLSQGVVNGKARYTCTLNVGGHGHYKALVEALLISGDLAPDSLRFYAQPL